MTDISYPHIALLVKGTAEQVQVALWDRGFHTIDRVSPVIEFIPGGMSPDHTVCRILVQQECEPGVLRWFEESEADETGYKIGALLTYFKRPASGVPVLPVAHSNGSGKENLIQDRLTALEPLRKSLEALCAMRPHGRDYTIDGASRQARDHHEKRIEAIRWVIAELSREALLIDSWK